MNPHSKNYRPGEYIFRENDRSRELYIIQKGNVKVYRVVAGREVELAILGKGSVLGEMALIDGRSRSASAKALDDCLLTIIGAEAFHDRVRGAPPWFMTLIKMTCQKIRNANRLLQNLGNGRHGVNIILAIEYLFAKHGESLGSAVTRRQLHLLLGASEQNVGRICEFLHGNKFICYSESTILLADKKMFSEYCDFLRLYLRKFFTRMAPPADSAREAIMALAERSAVAASAPGTPPATVDISGGEFREIVKGLPRNTPADELVPALERMGILTTACNEKRGEKADSPIDEAFQIRTERLRQWRLYFSFSRMVPCL